MFRVIKHIKVIFIILLTVAEMLLAAPQTLSEIKAKIIGGRITPQLLNDFDFYYRNNKINFVEEKQFFSQIKTSFESEYLIGLIEFKNEKFDSAFSRLKKLLKTSPKYFPYYDLFAKVVQITEKEKVVKETISTLEENKFNQYLQAIIEYNNAKYEDAKRLFIKITKSDSTSFHPNFMLAYTYRNLGKYNAALQQFKKNIALLDSQNPKVAKVWIAIGSLYYLSGNYSKAEKLYQKGLALASQTGYNQEKIKALLNIGMINDLSGDVKKGEEYFKNAISLASEINDKNLKATSLSEYAVSLTYAGKEIEARKQYLKSLSLLKKIRDKKRYALTAINIGNSYLNISNYVSSKKYFEIGLNESGDNIRTQMLALRGLGDVSTNLANYSEAIAYYEKSKELAKKINSLSAEAQINIGLGVLYYNINMPDKALRVLKDSEEKLDKRRNPYVLIELEQKLGIVYASIDSFNIATSYLIKSSELAEKYQYFSSSVLSKTFIANIKIHANSLLEAEGVLSTTMKKTKEIEQKQLLGVQYFLLSKIAEENHNFKKALQLLKTSMNLAENSHDYKTLIKTNYELGKIHLAQNKIDDAKDYFATAINLVELNSNRLFSNADMQINFFSNYNKIYRALIDIYLDENNFEEAFVILEKSKSKNSKQNLLSLQIASLTKDSKIIDRYFDLQWKIKSNLYNQTELENYRNELEKIEASISKFSKSKKYIFNEISKASISKIHSGLKNNQYFISYYVQSDKIYAFVFSNGNSSTVKINVTSKELQKLKKSISPYYNDLIGSNEISFNKDLFAFNADGANEFFEKIVRPVIANIPQNSDLIFSLPNEMLAIPLGLLVTKESTNSSPYLLDDKKFLIEDYSISYTPSAAIWYDLQNGEKSQNGEALLVGNPFFASYNKTAEERGIVGQIDFGSRNMEHSRLEYSEDEILNIASLFKNEKTLLAKNATETLFKKNVNNASIIHLSTHSFLYKNNPLILFSSNDKENDGFLEVGEILNLNIKSDMVVLSSCKSGLGQVDKSEGIIGMQKAFFDAGAKSVIVSLWDVNDKYTSVFMNYFYSFLAKGISKSNALQFAKKEFIKNVNPNPYYWAAFTLSGNDEALSFRKGEKNFLFIIFSLLLLSILGVYIYRKRIRKSLVIKTI